MYQILVLTSYGWGKHLLFLESKFILDTLNICYDDIWYDLYTISMYVIQTLLMSYASNLDTNFMRVEQRE